MLPGCAASSISGPSSPEPCNSRHLNPGATVASCFAAQVPTVELRAGIIIGPGSAAFEVMRDLVYNLPMMVTPKWVRSRPPPSPSPTSLHYLGGLVEADGVDGQIFNAAGPRAAQLPAAAQKFAAHIGKRCPIIPIPF